MQELVWMLVAFWTAASLMVAALFRLAWIRERRIQAMMEEWETQEPRPRLTLVPEPEPRPSKSKGHAS